MPPSSLSAFIHTLVPLSIEMKVAIDNLPRPTHYNKGDYLFKQNCVHHDAAFMVEGIARAFYLTNNGNEYNKSFFLKDSFPMPLTALITGRSNKINYQALSDCRVLLFNFKDFKDLFEKYPELKDFYIKAIEGEWIKKETHDINMVTNDATTNYQIFLKTFPGLDQLIPQYHIASYLGITPIQLSRIRASLYK